jgi:hypothetical protein
MTLLELDTETQQKVQTGDVTVEDALAAVRKTRAARRRATGRAKCPEGTACEPDFGFTRRNPPAAGHAGRRKYGGACAEYRENSIRSDKRSRGEGGQLREAAGPPSSADGRRLYAVPASAAAEVTG